MKPWDKPKKPKALWTTLPNCGKEIERQESLRAAIKDARKVAKEMIKRKRIAPISKKRQATSKEYREKAAAFVKAAIGNGQICEVVMTIPELRDGMKYGHRISANLNEVHHKRGRRGSLLTDERFWMPVSKQGHRFIHEHPDEARKHGWLCEVGQWNVPAR